MTPPNLFFAFAYSLLVLGASLLLTVARFVVLFEARRRGLTAFERWLVPSALASVASLAAQLFGSFGGGLLRGFPPGRSPLYALLLFEYGLDALAATLAFVAVFQLWRMIRGWPIGARSGGGTPPGVQAAGQQTEDVWPPPPTGPA